MRSKTGEILCVGCGPKSDIKSKVGEAGRGGVSRASPMKQTSTISGSPAQGYSGTTSLALNHANERTSGEDHSRISREVCIYALEEPK